MQGQGAMENLLQALGMNSAKTQMGLCSRSKLEYFLEARGVRRILKNFSSTHQSSSLASTSMRKVHLKHFWNWSTSVKWSAPAPECLGVKFF